MKETTMLPRDVILAQIHHHETNPVPYVFSYEGDVAKRLDAFYRGERWYDRLQMFIQGAGIVETMQKIPTERAGYERDLFGSIWRTDQRPFRLESPALTGPSLDGFRWPAPEVFYVDKERVTAAQQSCKEAKGQYFVIAFLGWGLFETS
jgi:hypothetical protein